MTVVVVAMGTVAVVVVVMGVVTIVVVTPESVTVTTPGGVVVACPLLIRFNGHLR